MKKVLYPKCDNDITFNEDRYEKNVSLFFVCPYCGKQFNVSVADLKNDQEISDCGFIVVLENSYGYRQELPLFMGDNIIGRRSKGTEIHVPIETTDITLARQHCVINVRKHKSGGFIYTLRDFPSVSGTYLRHERLGKKERVVLEDGAIITAGSTTFIVHFVGVQDNED